MIRVAFMETTILFWGAAVYGERRGSEEGFTLVDQLNGDPCAQAETLCVFI